MPSTLPELFAKIEASAPGRSTLHRNNEMRASEARILGEVMYHLTGVDPDPESDGPETCASDMICQMMHWAEKDGWDFETALRLAKGNFAAEVDGQE